MDPALTELPPLEYNVQKPANDVNTGSEPKNDPADQRAQKEEQEWISIDDLALPKSQIMRIFKDSVPPNTSLAKDARNALNDVTVTFISYLTFMATEITAKAGKKTINANDVLVALTEMDMPDIKATLETALEEYQALRESKCKAASKSTKETVVEIPVPEATSIAKSAHAAPTALRSSTRSQGQSAYPLEAIHKQPKTGPASDTEIDIMDLDDEDE